MQLYHPPSPGGGTSCKGGDFAKTLCKVPCIPLGEGKGPQSISLEFAIPGAIGLKKKTSSRSSYIGQLPLKCEATYRATKYWKKMISSEKYSLPIIAYEDLEKRNIAKSWYGKMQNIISQIGFRQVWLNKNKTSNLDLALYNIKQRLKDIEIQTWSSEIN